jgi:hypothetical protein
MLINLSLKTYVRLRLLRDSKLSLIPYSLYQQ